MRASIPNLLVLATLLSSAYSAPVIPAGTEYVFTPVDPCPPQLTPHRSFSGLTARWTAEGRSLNVVLESALERRLGGIACHRGPRGSVCAHPAPQPHYSVQAQRDVAERAELERRLGGIACHRGPRGEVCAHSVPSPYHIPAQARDELAYGTELERRFRGFGCHRGPRGEVCALPAWPRPMRAHRRAVAGDVDI